MAKEYIKYEDLLQNVQAYLSENRSVAMTSSQHYDQVKPEIQHYIRSNGLFVEGMTTDEIVESLYSEMVEYSFITPYLRRDDVDEVNINAWNDVVVTYSGGATEKLRSFLSPEHALDIIRKMLNESKGTLDEAIPIAEGQMESCNGRIMAMKHPLVDKSAYVSASIRLLHPSRIEATTLVEGGTASEDMIRFLCCCMRYGVSFVVAGATFSGKTTLLNALLKTLPNEKRIFTIENGSRELNLVRRAPNTEAIINNVVHTLARKSEKAQQNITMEKLVVASLRFNPDLIVVGEMRDEEAFAAIDASLTGHTLVSTIHAFAGEEAHMRLAMLCQKRFPMELRLSLMQAAKAFPVVCFEQQLADGSRKITNITECEIDMNGNRKYRELFRFVVENNEVVNGKTVVHGHYEAVEAMSEHLRQKMLMFGIPSTLLAQIDKR